MANFDELKKKAAEAAGSIVDKSAGFAKMAADKTKVYTKIMKIKADIAAENEAIRKAYFELGKLCYEVNKDAPDEAYAAKIAAINDSYDVIEAKKLEIDLLKADDEEEIDVEIIEGECCCDDEDCCCEDAAEKVEEAAEEVADKVEDVVEDVADAVEEIID